jgi:hypothetical protein
VTLDGVALPELLLLCSIIKYFKYLYYPDDGGLNITFNFFGLTFSTTGRNKGRQAAIKYMPLSTIHHPIGPPFFRTCQSCADIPELNGRYLTSLVCGEIGGKDERESIYGCEHASRWKDQLASE